MEMLNKNILILTHRNTTTPLDICNGYIREFIKNGSHFLDYSEIYKKFGNRQSEKYINNFIVENDIKILFFASEPCGFHFSVNFFNKLKDNVFLTMAVGDSDHYFDVRDIYYAQAMDLVVTYDYTSRFRFKQYGVNALSFYSSFDKDIYFKNTKINEDFDISFVGCIKWKIGRAEYLNYLAKHGLKAECFGSNTSNGLVSLDKMVDLFNRTKINLNFTGVSTSTLLTKDTEIHKMMKQMKGRIAEIALCGGFVLSEYAPGTEEVFEINKEIVVFNSKEELLEKALYYLKNEDEREKIANNAYIRALKDYEISTTIPKLINTLKELSAKKIRGSSALIIDKRFLKNYSTFRIPLMINFLKSGKISHAIEELLIIIKIRMLDMYQILYYIRSEISVLLDCFPKTKNFIKHIIK